MTEEPALRCATIAVEGINPRDLIGENIVELRLGDADHHRTVPL